MPRKPKTDSQKRRKLGIRKRRRYDKTYDAKRRRTHHKRIRSSNAYKQYRAWFMRQHPLCYDPFGDHIEYGETVIGEQMHHVKPIKNHPELAMDEDNCRSLCVSCHHRISMMEQKGEVEEAVRLCNWKDS